jgi:hypothetical protein
MASYRRDEYANPDGFISQMGLMFEGYGDDVITRASDIKNAMSIQRVCKFPPNLSEAAAACDAIFADIQHHADVLKRYGKPLGRGPHAPPPGAEDVSGAATASSLCQRYGLRAIPPGWDAVDVVMAAARHGAELHAVIDRGTTAPPSSQFRVGGGGFSALVERSRPAADCGRGGQHDQAPC